MRLSQIILCDEQLYRVIEKNPFYMQTLKDYLLFIWFKLCNYLFNKFELKRLFTIFKIINEYGKYEKVPSAWPLRLTLSSIITDMNWFDCPCIYILLLSLSDRCYHHLPSDIYTLSTSNRLSRECNAVNNNFSVLRLTSKCWNIYFWIFNL